MSVCCPVPLRSQQVFEVCVHHSCNWPGWQGAAIVCGPGRGFAVRQVAALRVKQDYGVVLAFGIGGEASECAIV